MAFPVFPVFLSPNLIEYSLIDINQIKLLGQKSGELITFGRFIFYFFFLHDFLHHSIALGVSGIRKLLHLEQSIFV